MRETKNFKESEWNCKHCGGAHKMKPEVMKNVQSLREIYGKPLVLTSAWRCEDHPNEIRKLKPGQHNQGTAVDIKVTDGAMSYELIKIGLALDATGFAVGGGFVHLDWRESTPAAWRY